MKCLLCEFNSNESQKLKDHYINFHKVDSENLFLKKLFKDQNNVFHGKRCVRCNEFLPTTKFKFYHDFLKHYEKFYFLKHSSDYDFHNSESLVDEFLFNVKNRIQRSDVDFFIRCGFSLENIQPSLDDGQPLTASRYWSTEPFQTKSFNDFVFFNIRSSVLKRVINNDMAGSSWHFNRFLYINIKTIKVSDQLVR